MNLSGKTGSKIAKQVFWGDYRRKIATDLKAER
jgi:hypothetical protein